LPEYQHTTEDIAERRIRELQEMMCTMLMIHAHHRWPSASTPNLWPYALRMANDAINAVNAMPNLHMPIESFTGTKVIIKRGNGVYHKLRFWEARYIFSQCNLDVRFLEYVR